MLYPLSYEGARAQSSDLLVDPGWQGAARVDLRSPRWSGRTTTTRRVSMQLRWVNGVAGRLTIAGGCGNARNLDRRVGVTAGAHLSRPPGGAVSAIAVMSAATGTVAKPTRVSLAPYGSHSSPSWTSPPQE